MARSGTENQGAPGPCLEHGLVKGERGERAAKPDGVRSAGAGARAERAAPLYARAPHRHAGAAIRIIEADQPRRREIPLSTLQRFITGAHHTQDHHVALCHAFVRELPYYGEGRDIAEVATALTNFFNAPIIFDAQQGQWLSCPDRDRLQIKYRKSSQGRAKEKRRGRGPPFARSRAQDRTLVEPQPEKDVIPRANLSSPRANWGHGDIIHGRDRRYAYEGVLISVPPQLYAVLRSSLTRRPKIYSFEAGLDSLQDTVAVLRGHGFDIDPLRSWSTPAYTKASALPSASQRMERAA